MSKVRSIAARPTGEQVELPEGAMDSSGVVASGESEQALLAAGKISVDEFMDMAVDRALSHLRGQISESRFSMMQEVLRAQLEQDPQLSALVAQVAQND